MDDVRSLTPDDLRLRIDQAITRRLDALSTDDRALAGHELLLVLDELSRRGCHPYPGRVQHSDGTPLSHSGGAL